MEVKMYHKPTCSTSRKALEIMKEAGIEPEIILYVKDAPSIRSIKSVAKKLGGIDRMIRKKEKLYQEQFANNQYSDEEWAVILHENPNLIERPIILKGRKAVIARPMNLMTDLLNIDTNE